MKLIEDLGVIDFVTYKKRCGIYECPTCKEHYIRKINDILLIKNKICKYCYYKSKNKTNSLRKTRLYGVWACIKQRCLNAKNKQYKDYGGRGITMCDEWKNDFKSFYDWAFANGYKEGLSIDRIDNDGSYYPENCRFVTQSTQSRNTRIIHAHNKSGFRGASYVKRLKKWQSDIRVNKKQKYIGLFNTPEEAGYAYDKYVIENNLEHTTNGLYKKEAV